MLRVKGESQSLTAQALLHGSDSTALMTVLFDSTGFMVWF